MLSKLALPSLLAVILSGRILTESSDIIVIEIDNLNAYYGKSA